MMAVIRGVGEDLPAFPFSSAGEIVDGLGNQVSPTLRCTDVPTQDDSWAASLCVASDNCFRGVLRLWRIAGKEWRTENGTATVCSDTSELANRQFNVSADASMEKYLLRRARFGPDSLDAFLKGPEHYSLRPSLAKTAAILGQDAADKMSKWPWTNANGKSSYRHPVLDSAEPEWEDPAACQYELHFHLIVSGSFRLSARHRNSGYDGVREVDGFHPPPINTTIIQDFTVEVCPQWADSGPHFNPILTEGADSTDCSEVEGPVEGTWLDQSNPDEQHVLRDSRRDAVFVPYGCANRHVDLASDVSGRSWTFCSFRCTENINQSWIFAGDSQFGALYKGIIARIDPRTQGFVLNPKVDKIEHDDFSTFGGRDNKSIRALFRRDNFLDRWWVEGDLEAFAGDYVVLGFGHWPGASTRLKGHWSHARYLARLTAMIRRARRLAAAESGKHRPLRYLWAAVQPNLAEGAHRSAHGGDNDRRSPDRMYLWNVWTNYLVFTGGRIPPGIPESSIAAQNERGLGEFDERPFDKRSLRILETYRRFLPREHTSPDGTHYAGAELESLADEVITKMDLCGRERIGWFRKPCLADVTKVPPY